MAEQKNTKHKGAAEKVAMGVGVAALAAAAAGMYFLYGTDKGKKQREALKGWMFKMKGEVMDRMEKMEDVSEGAYNNIVDTVARSYQGIKNIDKSEVKELADDLKKHWSKIKKHIATGGASKKSTKRKSPAKSKKTAEQHTQA